MNKFSSFIISAKAQIYADRAPRRSDLSGIPAHPRNSNGRLDFHGPTQEDEVKGPDAVIFIFFYKTLENANYSVTECCTVSRVGVRKGSWGLGKPLGVMHMYPLDCGL